MRVIKRLAKIASVGIIALSVGWTFLVFASAKTLGDAVFFAENDAYVMLALNALTIPALVIIAASFWRAGRARKRAAQTPVFTPAAPYPPTWGPQTPPSA